MNLFKKIKLHVSLEDSSREVYPETYQRELNYQCSRVLTFACLITFSWIPYIFIDRQLYPDQPLIVVLRVLFPVVGVSIMLLRLNKHIREYSLYLLTAYGLYLMVATGIITGLTGGDPVYMTGYILILCIIAMAPLRRKYSYVILGVSIAAFLAVGAFNGMNFDSVQSQYTRNDLVFTVAVVVFFIYLLDSIRFLSWRKSKRIEQSQKVIIVQRDQLEDQINLAGEIQKQLLPHEIPDILKASVAYTYHPMMGVGGDFVDIHSTADGKGLGLFICDVSGHGVAAAIISSMVKMSLSAWAEKIDQPADMLRSVYDSLRGKISAQFVTASICYIDLESGLLRMASAGHPPITVIRQKKSLEFFQPRGKFINDIVPPDYLNAETYLDPGDWVFLYTDGIPEAFKSDGGMYGEERLYRLLLEKPELSPGDLCEFIMDDLTEYTGTRIFEDDITILVTEYLG